MTQTGNRTAVLLLSPPPPPPPPPGLQAFLEQLPAAEVGVLPPSLDLLDLLCLYCGLSPLPWGWAPYLDLLCLYLSWYASRGWAILTGSL